MCARSYDKDPRKCLGSYQGLMLCPVEFWTLFSFSIVVWGRGDDAPLKWLTDDLFLSSIQSAGLNLYDFNWPGPAKAGFKPV